MVFTKVAIKHDGRRKFPTMRIEYKAVILGNDKRYTTISNFGHLKLICKELQLRVMKLSH